MNPLALSQDQRERLLPIVDRYAQQFGQYTAYRLSETEFIGTVPYSLPGPEWYLTEKAGYEYCGLSALKYHWNDPGRTDDGSFRKVDPENPRYQYHVHLFLVGDDPTQAEYHVASHYEMRPDLSSVEDESLSEMVSRLQTHYDLGSGTQGKVCDDVLELVE